MELSCDESFALARGLDLGLLLTKFPAYEHYELASRDIEPGHEIDLAGLVSAVGEDRGALAAPFDADPNIAACPNTFPLLAALRGWPTENADAAAVTRSLEDWCGRALLESAVFRRLANGGGGN